MESRETRSRASFVTWLKDHRVVDRDRSPIELYPRVGDDRWSDRELSQVTWAFVGLGILIRVVRFLLAHPLWGDECFVVANLVDRGYLGLLRPLDYQQVVPILFLWAELTSIKLLGCSEWSLRIFPTACAIASLFAFRHLASRLMKGLPVVFAVAIVAVALNPIRHGGEAKPYACDFLASAVLLGMTVEWWRRPDRSVWLWAMAATAPVAMGVSIPSTFVMGGISLAIAGPAWHARTRGVILAYLTFNLAILASAAASLAFYGGAGSAETKAYMDHYWAAMFPPMDDPVRLAVWLVKSHVGNLFAYPVGGSNGASLVTLIFALAGFVDFCRRGKGTIALTCAAPLGLALTASILRIYPYGESERLMQFEGPMICLLAGYGLAWSIGRFRQPGDYRKAAIGCLTGFAMLGLVAILGDVAQPGKTPEDLRAREFARWFWTEAGRDAELACVRSDLKLDFEGGPIHYGRSADYLTYQKIYSVRHHRDRPLDWSQVSSVRPLRCVLYDGVPADSTLFESWMARMNRHYRLTRVDTYRVNAGVSPRGVSSEDHLTVLEFVPKGSPTDPAVLASQALAIEARPSRGSLTLSGPR